MKRQLILAFDVATVFRLPADVSNLHNLVAFQAPWVRILHISNEAAQLPTESLCHLHRTSRTLWQPAHCRQCVLSTLSPLLPRAVAPPLLQIFAFNIIHYKWQIIFQTSSEHINKKKIIAS